ncbi:MAG: ABC transporter permease, partial [Clostridia bacterium]|nr:ABC transporter permease [Clostridia bacterium]
VFIVCSWVMLVLLPFVTVALISIMIGRKIKGEQKVIGTLSAMGYTKNRLTLHYSIFALIPGIIGGALTTVLAFVLAGPFGKIGLADYEPLQPAFTLPVWVALTAILIPTVIYWLCAVVKVRRMLQRDTVDLLNNKVGNEGKNRRILAQKKTKVGIKMAVRSLVSNPGRSLVVFLGIFLGAMIIAFSLSMIDSIKEVGKSAHRDFGAFKYDYVLNTLQDGSPDYGEAVLVLPYETEGGTRFSVMGVDEDNTLWNLTTTSGKKADTKTGWYTSKLCAAIFGVKEGDTFTFRNTATLEEKSVRIDGIINNGYQMFIVSSRENVGGITELSSSKYNSILSDKALDFDDSVLSEVISDNTYETQMENLLSSMGGIIYSLAIIGAIICAVSLYAIVNMMVTENANNISMLKVLGMKNGKINNMVISANHLLLIPGIITGIAVAYAGMVWYCAAFIKIERIMIPATLHWYSILITAAIVILCYFVSLLLVRGKVNRTDMVECLKDNRE